MLTLLKSGFFAVSKECLFILLLFKDSFFHLISEAFDFPLNISFYIIDFIRNLVKRYVLIKMIRKVKFES